MTEFLFFFTFLLVGFGQVLHSEVINYEAPSYKSDGCMQANIVIKNKVPQPVCHQPKYVRKAVTVTRTNVCMVAVTKTQKETNTMTQITTIPKNAAKYSTMTATICTTNHKNSNVTSTVTCTSTCCKTKTQEVYCSADRTVTNTTIIVETVDVHCNCNVPK